MCRMNLKKINVLLFLKKIKATKLYFKSQKQEKKKKRKIILKVGYKSKQEDNDINFPYTGKTY